MQMSYVILFYFQPSFFINQSKTSGQILNNSHYSPFKNDKDWLAQAVFQMNFKCNYFALEPAKRWKFKPLWNLYFKPIELQTSMQIDQKQFWPNIMVNRNSLQFSLI